MLLKWELEIYKLDLQKIIWDSSAQICLFFPFYLFNHLFRSVWTPGYLLYALSYNPTLLYLFSHANFSSFGHWKIFQLVPVLLGHIPVIVGFVFLFVFCCCYYCFSLSPSLFSGTRACCRVTLYISCPNSKSAVSPRGLGYFYGRVVLESSISLLLSQLLVGPLSWQNKEVCVCVQTSIYTHTYKYFGMYSFGPILR